MNTKHAQLLGTLSMMRALLAMVLSIGVPVAVAAKKNFMHPLKVFAPLTASKLWKE
jgi:hypothetical protein